MILPAALLLRACLMCMISQTGTPCLLARQRCTSAFALLLWWCSTCTSSYRSQRQYVLCNSQSQLACLVEVFWNHVIHLIRQTTQHASEDPRCSACCMCWLPARSLQALRISTGTAFIQDLLYAVILAVCTCLCELRYMLQLPACCLKNRKYCLDPVQPSRQKGYSSYGVIIRSIRRTLPVLVMNMPNTLSNLYTDTHTYIGQTSAWCDITGLLVCKLSAVRMR